MAGLFIAACQRPVLKVEKLPANTPAGARIFVSGNFNRWDPGDQRFVMELQSDSNFYIMLPAGMGEVQFKFTRGDWSSVETDLCGYEIENRSFYFGKMDTIVAAIQSWKDLGAINCPEVTIVLDKVPQNTPANDPIAIAGSFNEWLPDSNSVFKQQTESGKYFLTIPRLNNSHEIEYKITRGNLLKAEADKFGNEIEKRKLRFGTNDTVFVEVENWEDMKQSKNEKMTIIVQNVPKQTLPDDIIYITGSFNGWYPKDNNYILEKNKNGKYQIALPRTTENIQFKFTRGDWSKQEVDKWGYKIPNRTVRFADNDTLFVQIENWNDRSGEIVRSYFFIINKWPPTTPGDARLFLAGSINGWDANNKNYRFEKLPNGSYFLKVQSQAPTFEYKITRGKWTNEEADKLGNKITNRVARQNDSDTLQIQVINWLDIPEMKQEFVVLVIDSLPDYTPKDRKIFVAGTFNNWNPGNTDYVMSKNLKGHYYIAIPKKNDAIGFKFTLGSWENEELDKNMNTVPNRTYRFGYADTLLLKVENWEGFAGQ